MIAFVHTMLRHTKLTKMTTTLVLTPLNTVLNWETEFENWLQAAKPLDVGVVWYGFCGVVWPLCCGVVWCGVVIMVVGVWH